MKKLDFIPKKLNSERIQRLIQEGKSFKELKCTAHSYRIALKKLKEKQVSASFGYKNQPYYEKEEDYYIPNYSVNDLKGDELKIYNKLKKKKKL